MPGSKILTLIVALSWAIPAQAVPDSAALCDAAAGKAAAETGVPLDILLAIARAETGRRTDGVFKPWPWAINDAGQGYWFDSEDAALAAATERWNAGDDNFDIGCFQINTHWHGQAFGTLAEMFDPVNNARYAAKYLSALKDELGGWDQAIGAYHSRTPDLAGPYLDRVNALRGVAPLDPGQPVRLAEAAPRPNLFPLLQAGEAGSPGSLVPLQSGLQPLFDDRG